jgi:hypothetical protein
MNLPPQAQDARNRLFGFFVVAKPKTLESSPRSTVEELHEEVSALPLKADIRRGG